MHVRHHLLHHRHVLLHLAHHLLAHGHVGGRLLAGRLLRVMFLMLRWLL
jgi:hypothetical protein